MKINRCLYMRFTFFIISDNLSWFQLSKNTYQIRRFFFFQEHLPIIFSETTHPVPLRVKDDESGDESHIDMSLYDYDAQQFEKTIDAKLQKVFQYSIFSVTYRVKCTLISFTLSISSLRTLSSLIACLSHLSR